MKAPLRITIVGAGMTGLALAALLAGDSRLELRIIDSASQPRRPRDGGIGLRVSALSPATMAVLRGIGAFDTPDDLGACPYDRMRVWDAACAADGPQTLRFDADEFAVAELGHIVDNELVRFALVRVLSTSSAVLDFDTTIEGLERGVRGFSLNVGGVPLETDLLIGADGGRSIVRDAAEIASIRYPYAQSALVTHVRPERSHENTARQRFLPRGPLGMLPLSDGRVSIVWSTLPEHAEELLRVPDVELGRALSEASDGVLGELEVAGPRGAFPLAASYAERYVDSGVALVGDAAHTVHPLAGQGVNLGFADVAELAGVIVRALDAGEFPADRPVLRRYERARRGQNDAVMHALTGLNGLFASDFPGVGTLRRRGMQLFNLSGPVRSKALGVALGMQPGR